MSDADCQCSLWTTQPDVLASKGLPRGFCGPCEVCGRPGHMRHFPGSSPSTGNWCEKHHRRLLWLHPMGWSGRRLDLATLIAGLAAFTLWHA